MGDGSFLFQTANVLKLVVVVAQVSMSEEQRLSKERLEGLTLGCMAAADVVFSQCGQLPCPWCSSAGSAR